MTCHTDAAPIATVEMTSTAITIAGKAVRCPLTRLMRVRRLPPRVGCGSTSGAPLGSSVAALRRRGDPARLGQLTVALSHHEQELQGEFRRVGRVGGFELAAEGQDLVRSLDVSHGEPGIRSLAAA